MSLQAFADPEKCASGGDGPPVSVAAGNEAGRRLVSAKIVTRIFVTTVDEEGAVVDEDFTVATVADELWLVGGYENNSSGERQVAARTLSADTLRTLLAGCLTP